MDTISPSATSWLRKVLSLQDDFEIKSYKHAYAHQDDVFVISINAKSYYLKIADDLHGEYENLLRLKPLISVPEVVGYETLQDKDLLLLSEIPGENLAELVDSWTSVDVVQAFAYAVKQFHALDPDKLFPGMDHEGVIVIHGDMALPNVLFDKDRLSGYIDLGQLTLGNADVDLADALWSLQRNLGPGFGEQFLQAYGPTPMTTKLAAALHYVYKT